MAFLNLVLVLVAQEPPQPARPSVAVMDLTPRTGTSPDLAVLLTERLASGLREGGAFSRVVASGELRAALSHEQQKEALDCTDASCVAEIAGALNVDKLVVGSLGRVGELWVVNVSLVDARSGQAEVTASREAAKESQLWQVARDIAAQLSPSGAAELPEGSVHRPVRRVATLLTGGMVPFWMLSALATVLGGLAALGVAGTPSGNVLSTLLLLATALPCLGCCASLGGGGGAAIAALAMTWRGVKGRFINVDKALTAAAMLVGTGVGPFSLLLLLGGLVAGVAGLAMFSTASGNVALLLTTGGILGAVVGLVGLVASAAAAGMAGGTLLLGIL